MTASPFRPIHRTLFVVALGAFAVSACGAAQEAVSERLVEQAAGGDVDIELDDDGQVASIQTEDGSLDMSVGGDLPSEWPADVPLFDGGTLTSSQVAVSNGQTIVSLTYDTDRAADDAVDSLQAVYEAAGFTTTATSDMGDDTGRLVGYVGDRDGTTVSVTATSGADDPTVLLVGVVYPAE